MRRHIALWIAIALCGAQFGLMAAPPAASTARRKSHAEQSPAKPGDVDTKNSRSYVYVGKTGLGHEHAIEGIVAEGGIELGASEDAGFVEFDMTTFSADTKKAREYIGLDGEVSKSTQRKVTDNMLGEDVLDTKKYATARFDIDSATKLARKHKEDPTRYQLSGEFTLHGVTRPLNIVAEIEPLDDSIRLKGSFTIRQTDYGIEPYSAALGAVGITDELTIYGDLRLALPKSR